MNILQTVTDNANIAIARKQKVACDLSIGIYVYIYIYIYIYNFDLDSFQRSRSRSRSFRLPIYRKRRQTGQTLILPMNIKSHMAFRWAYLHFTFSYSIVLLSLYATRAVGTASRRIFWPSYNFIIVFLSRFSKHVSRSLKMTIQPVHDMSLMNCRSQLPFKICRKPVRHSCSCVPGCTRSEPTGALSSNDRTGTFRVPLWTAPERYDCVDCIGTRTEAVRDLGVSSSESTSTHP